MNTTIPNIKAFWIKYSNLKSFSGRTSLTVVTFVANAFLGALTGIMTARLLGPHGQGELNAMQAWAVILGSIAGLGMSEAVIYFGKRYPHQASTYLISSFVPVGLSSSLLLVLGWWLMPLFLHAQTQEVIESARLLMVLMIPLFGFFIVYESLRTFNEWKAWNLLRFIPNLYWILVLAVVFLVPKWANSIFLIKLWPIMFILQCIPALIIVKWKHAHQPVKVNPAFIKPLLGFSIPVMATSIPLMLNLKLDQLMMASFLPAQLLGLYVTAVTWSLASSSIFAALSQVLFPQISSLNTGVQQKKTISSSILLSSSLGVLLTIFLLVITPFMLPFLFGVSFRPAVPVALVLIIASWFANMNTVLESILRGLGHPRKVLFSELFGLVITILLLTLLLPKYEIMGAGIASLAAYSVVTLATLFFVWKAVYFHNT